MRRAGISGFLLMSLVFMPPAAGRASAEEIQVEGKPAAAAQAEPAAATGPKRGEIRYEPMTGMEFVWVPGGCYQMGSRENEAGRDPNEGPVHEVCVDGFWMGRYEVTNCQYRQWKTTHDSKDHEGYTLNGENQPAVNVNWENAKAFVAWLSRQGKGDFRLPTEAEWEYACRAGTETSRYWGDNSSEACLYANVADQTAKKEWPDLPVHDCDDGFTVTAPTGRFQPNGFGLFDMLGNVWEWCEDKYGKNAYGTHRRDNPLNMSGGRRVVRGGGWEHAPRYVRCAFRYRLTPGSGRNVLGFRLVGTF